MPLFARFDEMLSIGEKGYPITNKAEFGGSFTMEKRTRKRKSPRSIFKQEERAWVGEPTRARITSDGNADR